MADADDVRRLALSLPHVEEIDSDGFDFRVGNRGFVWSYPERLPGKPRVIRTDIAVLFVGDEAEKQALLLGEPGLFFTTPGYEGLPLVMLRLPAVSAERLTELVTDAWRMRAPDGLAIARPLTVAFDARDPARLARFWAGLLGRTVIEDAFLPGDDTQLGLRFVAGPGEKAGPNRMHLHLTGEDQRRTVATALALGASHLDVGQRPEEEHVVLADPEGNEFCVIEPGNAFLAGCGPLGELACDGTREAGLFWSAALGWPLVWDHDGETAIQSPRGGTKVAWGGPPVAPRKSRNRQRFELAPPAEIDRLLALGATQIESDPVLLADPDGNEFSVKL